MFLLHFSLESWVRLGCAGGSCTWAMYMIKDLVSKFINGPSRLLQSLLSPISACGLFFLKSSQPACCMWGYWKEGRGGRGKAKIMRWLSIEGVRSQARCLMTEWELLHQVQQLLQSVANEHFERRQGCPGREMPTSLSSPADGFSCESKQLPILGTFWLFRSLETGCCPGGGSPSPLGSPVCFYSEPLLMSLKKGHIHNQKRPHTNRGHIQNFNVQKWSDKSALFLIILGFYRGFLWQCSILIPTPLYHVALPHLKTILKSRTVAPKLFCIGLPLFEARYRKWSTRTCCRLAKRISRKKADAEMGESKLCSSLEGPFLNFETRSLIMYMDHVHEPPAQPSRTQLSRVKCDKNAIPWS